MTTPDAADSGAEAPPTADPPAPSPGLFESMVRENADMIAVIDPLGRFAFVNEAARRILGWDSEQWIGRDGFELIHPDDHGLAAESLASTIEEGGVREPLLLRLRHADGSWRHVEILANNLTQHERVAGLLITARDVSARQQAERSADEARDRFEQAFDRAPIGMAIVANDGKLLRVNAALSRMLNSPMQELTGQNLLGLAHPQDRAAATRHAVAVLNDDHDRPVEVRFLRQDGSSAWARVTSTMIRDANGAPLHAIVQIEDVTEQRIMRELLEQAATHDPLTNLLNRAGLEVRFDQATDDESSALLLVDLDGFKLVNDTHGHAAGDLLLQHVAHRIRDCLRISDIAARIGGDEFVVYVREVTDARDALAVGRAHPHRDRAARPLAQGNRPGHRQRRRRPPARPGRPRTRPPRRRPRLLRRQARRRQPRPARLERHHLTAVPGDAPSGGPMPSAGRAGPRAVRCHQIAARASMWRSATSMSGHVVIVTSPRTNSHTSTCPEWMQCRTAMTTCGQSPRCQPSRPQTLMDCQPADGSIWRKSQPSPRSKKAAGRYRCRPSPREPPVRSAHGLRWVMVSCAPTG